MWKSATKKLDPKLKTIRDQISEFLSTQRTSVWMDQLLEDMEAYNG